MMRAYTPWVWLNDLREGPMAWQAAQQQAAEQFVGQPVAEVYREINERTHQVRFRFEWAGQERPS